MIITVEVFIILIGLANAFGESSRFALYVIQVYWEFGTELSE